MIIKKFTSTPLENNTYLLIRKPYAVVIDFAGATNQVFNYLKDNNLELQGCFITHSHFDHFFDIENFMKKFPNVNIYVYEKQLDLFLNNNLSEQLSGQKIVPKKSYLKIYKGDIEVNHFEKLKCLPFPGHTKGSVVFQYDNHYFTGDFVFENTIGRTDLPTGNSNIMQSSLKKFNAEVNGEAFIHPGHGNENVFSVIRNINPYFKNL